MKVVGRKELETFSRKHADVRGQIDAWLAEVEEDIRAGRNMSKAFESAEELIKSLSK